MNKTQEKIGQIAYGGFFSGLIVIGLLTIAKEKTIKSIKKSMTLIKSKTS